MAARSIGSATISFGLVSIPVRIYAATQPSAALSFNLLHQKCGSRLRQQLVCPADGEVVPREQAVKGYEFAKDRYVAFTPEELEALEQAPSRTIDIAEFIPLEKVDPVYFDRAYYLGPDKGGAKAYRLLVDALVETGRVAVARFAARGKQYLTLLRPRDDRLVMEQLLYAGEVRPAAEVPVEPAELKEAEKKLAVQLVEQGTGDTFRPETYRDEVADRTRAAIQKKIEGEEIEVPPAEVGGTKIVDLMEALKKSVEGGNHEGHAARNARSRTPRAHPPRRREPAAHAPGKG